MNDIEREKIVINEKQETITGIYAQIIQNIDNETHTNILGVEKICDRISWTLISLINSLLYLHHIP